VDLKEKIRESPNKPGVYLFKDGTKAIIYVGKAASINKRLKSHFSKTASVKQRAMIDNVADVDYILTPDESTALLLESALIKKHDPKYNISLKDDKSYPRLKLTINEEFPRLSIIRALKDDGAVYFGPYTNSKLLRSAVDFMRRTFPLRTCQKMPDKECLNFYIGQCIAPCVDRTKKKEYLKIVEEVKLLLDGNHNQLIERLNDQMQEASLKKEYERATKIRDRLKALSVVSAGSSKFKDIPDKDRIRFYPNQQIEQLRNILDLPKTPHIIEAFDVSNTFGKGAVGSMVSFKDGKPNTSAYRKFKIKTVRGIDDYSMMREIISRRYNRLIYEKSPLPDLIIIDGGKGHLIASKKELVRLNLWNIPTISIAKGLEKIFVSEKKEPLLLGKFEAALLLLRRIRDEAHRFAISYHRLLRKKEIGVSELDNIDGIGPKKKASLIRYFGSLDEIRMADVEDLIKVDYINEKYAKSIYNYFRGEGI